MMDRIGPAMDHLLGSLALDGDVRSVGSVAGGAL
jgi:hypothetical protein